MVRAKILVVEDEETTRALVVTELEKAGHEVFQAKDGIEAMSVARAVRPILILCDIVMPAKDGNTFIKDYRESGFGKDVQFIILTSHGQMRDYFDLMGVDDFIAKPVRPEELLLRVERVLQKSVNAQEDAGKQAGSPKEEEGGKKEGG